MIMKIRTTEIHGYPEFRMDGPPITESGDGLRLQNWTHDIYNKFRIAFKLHSDATAAVRKKTPGAEGMKLAVLVYKMLGFPKCDQCDRLQLLQEAAEKIIPLLPKDNEDVRNLVKVLKIK